MPEAAPAVSGAFVPELSRGEAARAMRKLFAAAALETPELDARLLAGHALGLDPLALALSAEMPVGAAAEALARVAARRLAHEPVARIIGTWEFYGLPFELDAATLVPRPETETLVDAVLAQVPRAAALRILDLGTGSGAILVALLHALPNAFGVGIDRATAALRVAQRNAESNGIAERAVFVAGHWAEAVAGGFDVVVANPPYVASAVIATLADEVRCHDPWLALDGGADGCDAYRAIARELPRLLVRGGRAVLEIGYDQAEAVCALLAEAGFAAPRVGRDLCGRSRLVLIRAGGARPSNRAVCPLSPHAL